MSTDLVTVIVPAAVPVAIAVVGAIEKIVVAWIKRRREGEDGENEGE
ncbi:hypothetical protein [Amycolatopsis sp. NPDC004625]